MRSSSICSGTPDRIPFAGDITMEQLWSKASFPLTVQDLPQEAVETACSHALDLIQRNCEYLDQHFAHIRPDPDAFPESHRQNRHFSACRAQARKMPVFSFLGNLPKTPSPSLMGRRFPRHFSPSLKLRFFAAFSFLKKKKIPLFTKCLTFSP